MNTHSCNLDRCSECMSNYVCSCMRITEASLIATIASLGIDNLYDLRVETGAGDGCMACRRRLQHYIDEYAPTHVSRERVTAVSLEVVG